MRPESSTSSFLGPAGNGSSMRLQEQHSMGPQGVSSMILPDFASSTSMEGTRQMMSANPNDPATTHAPTRSCYSTGAAKMRGVGKHYSERSRIDRVKARAKARHSKHAQVTTKYHADHGVQRPTSISIKVQQGKASAANELAKNGTTNVDLGGNIASASSLAADMSLAGQPGGGLTSDSE